MRTLLAAILLTAASPASAAGAGLPWVRDDYAAALAQARARQVPLVIDVWTPW
jgi:hypothetical protein